MGITKVVREMEFLELGYFFSKFFKVGISFEMGLKIAKIGIFEEVYRKISNVKFGKSKKFLENPKNGGFHWSFGEKSMKKWFFSVFEQK